MSQELVRRIVLPMVEERSREPGDAWDQAAKYLASLTRKDGREGVDISQELCAFLLGEADLGGVWFGDEGDKPYWWRTLLSNARQQSALKEGASREGLTGGEA